MPILFDHPDFPDPQTIGSILLDNVESLKTRDARVTVKLQVIEGRSWMIWMGDIPTDKRGWWGTGIISGGYNARQCLALARYLITQAEMDLILGEH